MFFNKKEKYSSPIEVNKNSKYDFSWALQLKAAWSVIDEKDTPMVPCIVSDSLDVRLSLVVNCSQKYFNQEVYIQYISKEDKIEDLFYLNKAKKIYSSLMTAIKLGQTAVLYPVGHFNQKIFSFLTPLLSGQNYIPSFETGENIVVNKNFRLVVFLNESDLNYEISREHSLLLSPKIFVYNLNKKDIRNYLTEDKDIYKKELLDHIISVFNESKGSISLEDARNILKYSSKIYQKNNISFEEVVEEAIHRINYNKDSAGFKKNLFKIGL